MRDNEPCMPDEAPKSKPTGGLGNLVQAESMIQLALAVPAGCFAGLLIGALLDRHFHKHWISIALMILGSIGGFIQIFTSMSKNTGRDQ